ncbi:MAG: pyridoxal phosphate-dependent aminotransferase [Bacteroidota bacterium]
MISHLSDRVNAMALPMTIAMAKKSRALQEQGLDIISLSLGEPDFDTPDLAKAAGIEGIEQNFSHYMPVSGYVDVRDAVAHKFLRDNQLTYTRNQIVVSTGAKQSIANLMMALVNPGDEVVIPAPFWVSYNDLAEFCGATVVSPVAGREQGFKITPDQLRKALSPKSKVFIFSSPNNPSGAMYRHDELEALAAVLRDFPNVVVVADEIYEYLSYGEVPHYSFARIDGMFDRTATVNGMSKGYAMTGWRLGFMGAPEWLAEACDKVQSQFTSGASSIAQRAARAALLAGPQPVQYMVEAFKARRDRFLQALRGAAKLHVDTPPGAFYAYVDVRAYLDHRYPTSNDLVMYLLEHGVAGVPGEAFGTPGYLRFSYAASQNDLDRAAERIVKALNAL